ncbi:MAG: hypothetical protein LQ342_007226 [Letrouitia transgressa]|nr:MAG: hypothetical protein LQ342_007226 [Letrouitia transgressa]
MREKINQLGGDINSSNIRIRKCHELKGGGFDSDYGISICSNNMRSRSHMEDTLAHGLMNEKILLEMIHAYDHLRFQVQWRDNLRHAACSEIRASALSGECRWAVEFFGKNQWKFSQHLQDCVKRRAVLSVAGRPNCKDDVEAAKVVNEVWDSCFPDTRPFDEVYR